MRTVLIDGSLLLVQAWRAIPNNLRAPDGLPTNAAFGFARTFRTLFARKTPDRGAVVFDGMLDPDLPHALTRQLPSILSLCQAHNFGVVRVAGVPGRHVLATLATRAVEQGDTLTLVSGDPRLRCFATGDHRVLDPYPMSEVWYDAAAVFRRHGVGPESLIDWLTLVGDRERAIPGIKGIGAKTASALLNEHGTLDRVLTAGAGTARVRKALSDTAALAASQAAASLDVGVPGAPLLDTLEVQFPTPEALNAVYRRLGFNAMLVGERAQGVAYFVCDTQQVARAALRELTDADLVAVHPLLDGDHIRGTLVGLAFSPAPGRALYYPFAGKGSTLPGLGLLKPWLEDADQPKVCHDAKALYGALVRHGVTLAGVTGDTRLGSHLVDPEKLLPHRLDQVAREYARRGVQDPKVLGAPFAELQVGRAGAYACHLADTVTQTWPPLVQALRRVELLHHLRTRDLPLSFVLARSEQSGVPIDPERLTALRARLEAERHTLESEIHSLAGHPFNVGSVRQLGTVLFEELELPVLRRTRTGYATASDVLERLSDRHPICEKVLRWRTLSLLIQTWCDPLRDAVDPDTGRVHSTVNLTAAASGRLINTEPDLQRTPGKTPELAQVRAAFVADPGWVILSADWSQLELRVLAHFTQDPLLVDALTRGLDLHRTTAAALFDIAESDVTHAQREVGKTVNFATFYGQGSNALAFQLGIEPDQARDYIRRFDGTYAAVRAWQDGMVEAARKRGWTPTLLGRRRTIMHLHSTNSSDLAYGERLAANTPIQASAADLCRAAILDIDTALRREGLRARLLLSIHDELIYEVPRDEVDATTAIVRQAMEQGVPLSVPLVVGIGTGPTWAEAKK